MQAQIVLSMVAGADLPEEIPETVRFQWQRAALYQGAQFYRLLHAQDEMVELLEGHGFHPAILKEMAAAIYYPAPETRTMGDIDFILPREELEAGFSLLRENGYVLEVEENANNNHILLAKDVAHFELHRYFGKFDSVEKCRKWTYWFRVVCITLIIRLVPGAALQFCLRWSTALFCWNMPPDICKAELAFVM